MAFTIHFQLGPTHETCEPTESTASRGDAPPADDVIPLDVDDLQPATLEDLPAL
jgi:hypothetical protein